MHFFDKIDFLAYKIPRDLTQKFSFSCKFTLSNPPWVGEKEDLALFETMMILTF